MIKKAQATLEFSLVLIIAVGLIAGFYVMARWVAGHIPNRQDSYDLSRKDAGQKSSPGQPERVYEASVFADSADWIYLFRK
ncbi:MAG: hypothetical protein PHR84_00800 [Candidatus Omnitrophica bacterium]|jgi:hypothetical protein|nr:hypothetical protein [Candidatus Omnitrophota bacterium]MDD5661446.1 hypothetical protein [Candidatus Omnitrophota bacterium]